MPFSAAGALIVLLVIGLVGQTAWSRHQRSLNVADDISLSALMMNAAAIHGDLQNSARWAVYQALSEVGERASDFDDDGRELAVENLATSNFRNRVRELVTAYNRHDSRVQIDIIEEENWPTLELEEIDDGYASARAGFPTGSRIKLTALDGRASVAVPFDNVGAFIDSRYFLLDEKMGEFLERLGNVTASWQAMELAKAWAGAWGAGNIALNKSQTRALFEVAWDLHEINNFGSFDYWAAAKGLINGDGGDQSTAAPSAFSDLHLPSDMGLETKMDSVLACLDNAIRSVDNASSLAVLEGVRNDLDDLSNSVRATAPTREGAGIFEDGEADKGTAGNPPLFNIDRENFYGLLPPSPIRPSPGISVYHQLEVKDVSYRREDPAGLLGSPTATPIPLPFVGVTLWWGQWRVAIELRNPPVEKIFDFDNPTLPIAHGSYYLHEPLAYHWQLSDEVFSTRIIVMSLRPFTISLA